MKYFLGQSPLGFHRVAYAEWGKPTAKPPVICVHGLTRNGRDFDTLAKHLQSSAQIFCPDMIGRGHSDWLKDPTLYNYPQYLADTTALIARTQAEQIDWIGTSMGGIIGMLIAAQPQTPIRRLIINDVGPHIPLAALKRIAGYVGMAQEFDDIEAIRQHLRLIYASFGITRDEDWQHLAQHSYRMLPNGKLAMAHDPAIARNFEALDKDVDFWNLYDKIACPTLVIHGAQSDILPDDVAQQMTQRGPKAKLVTLPGIGHAPALISADQIKLIEDFLNS
jgi:pimeloyl-ACP methyl ester carboxylesterase